MANARKQNVWIIDTTGLITTTGCIHSVKLCSGVDASTAVIQNVDDAGDTIYQIQSGAAADVFEPNVELSVKTSFYVTLTGTSPKLYLYME